MTIKNNNRKRRNSQALTPRMKENFKNIETWG